MSPEAPASPADVSIEPSRTSVKLFAETPRPQDTRRAYQSDWKVFATWCGERKLEPLPALLSTVAQYLAERAQGGKKPATLARALAAVSLAHRLSGLPLPTADARLQQVLKGIRRTVGVAPSPKTPLMPAELRAICLQLPATPRSARSRTPDVRLRRRLPPLRAGEPRC